MKKRRICFVAPYAGPVLLEEWQKRYSGGAELQQVLLACALAERGHDVSFVLQDTRAKRQFVHRGLSVFGYSSPRLAPGVNALLKCRRLWNLLIQIKPEVIYQRMADWTTGICAAFARRHGGLMIHAVASDRDVSATEPMDGNWWQARLYHWGLQRCSLVLAQHPGQVESLRRDFSVESEIFPSVYMDCEDCGSNERRGVLWIAMMRPNKRPELLLELARRLPQVPFTMIGGPEGDPASREYYAEVEKAASGVANVCFAGFLSPGEIDQKLRQALLLVSTTQPKREGLPVAFLQAWRHGVPTVGFSAPGLDDVLEETGWSVQSLDELTQLVGRLRDEPALFTSRGRQAQRYFRERHAMSVVIPRFESMMEDAWVALAIRRAASPALEVST